MSATFRSWQAMDQPAMTLESEIFVTQFLPGVGAKMR